MTLEHELELLEGFLRRMRLSWLLRHFPPRLVWTAFVYANCFVAMTLFSVAVERGFPAGLESNAHAHFLIGLDMDVVQRRKALANALTAHDAEAVKLLLHPSFKLWGRDGVIVMDRAELAGRLPAFFQEPPGIQADGGNRSLDGRGPLGGARNSTP